MYQSITQTLERFFPRKHIFKYGFNISPMYRRTTGKIISISDDLTHIDIRIKKSWRNQNYMGTIFGGSMFAATDPIYMIQYIQLLGKDYIVWDKAGSIVFKRPGKSTLYATFVIDHQEIEEIKKRIAQEKEITFEKQLSITDANKKIIAEVSRTIYIADAQYYKSKRKKRNSSK